MTATREQRLAETFVELADTLVADFDVIDFLDTLTGRCVELLGVDAAGVALADPSGRLHPTAASSETARLLELFEMQSHAGPCVDAYTSGRPVINVALDSRLDTASEVPRWPRFAEAARSAGYVSAHALPLRLRAQVVGALNLFCVRNVALTDADARLGQALADVATIGILQQRGIRDGETLASQLQSALNSRVVIEQAKGVLTQQGGLAMDTAFDTLRGHARRNGVRISDLAQRVVQGTVTVADLTRQAAMPPS